MMAVAPRVTEPGKVIFRQRAEPILPLLDWAAENITLADGPREGARYDADFFPLQTSVLESFDDPRWSVRVVVAPPQRAGKSTMVQLLLAHRLAHLRQNCLYVHSNADDAQTFYSEKLFRTLTGSRALRGMIPELRDDQGRGGLRKFTNGRYLILTGSESAGALSAKTLRVIIGDDCQDMKAALGQRGHPMDLAVRRAGAFHESQITVVLLGTAGLDTDYHWSKLKASTFYVPYVPCTGCGAYQWLDWRRAVYDENDPVAAHADTWLRCANEECEHKLRDSELPAMLKRHVWVSCAGLTEWPATVEVSDAEAGSGDAAHQLGAAGDRRRARGDGRKGVLESRNARGDVGQEGERIQAGHRVALQRESLDRARREAGIGSNVDGWHYPHSRIPTRIAGFWWNALYWPNATWGSIAVEAIAARGNPDAQRSFEQNQLCVPTTAAEVAKDTLEPSKLESLRDPAHRWGTIPAAADCHGQGGILVVTADPGGGFVWYQVQAWRISDGSSWLVELGRIGDKPDVSMVATEEEKHQIWARGVNAALVKLNDRCALGWPVAETGEVVFPTSGYVDCGAYRDGVYPFVQAYSGWFATFGSVQRHAPLWPTEPTVTDSGEVIHEVNTSRGKFIYRGLVELPLGSPGGLTLPGSGIGDAEARLLETMHRHLCGEFYDDANRKWKRTGANHFFDTGSLQICGAKHREVKIGTGETTQPMTTSQRKPERTTETRSRFSRDGRPFVATNRGPMRRRY